MGQIREEIAQICHNDDFTTEMADRKYITQNYETAPEEVKESYRQEVDQILALIYEWGNEDCSHGYTGNGVLLRKRNCGRCWQELKGE